MVCGLTWGCGTIVAGMGAGVCALVRLGAGGFACGMIGTVVVVAIDLAVEIVVEFVVANLGDGGFAG